MLKLYGYFRSSAAYRVRIALNWKQLEYENVPVHLVNNGGEHLHPDYQAINPQSLVPTLVDENENLTLSQSLAILHYLEQQYPKRKLQPENIQQSANMWQIAQIISCDIHPLNNLRVLKYLTDKLNCDKNAKQEWYQHWVKEGFMAIEKLLEANQAENFCCAEKFTIADCCLIPQVYNALRFECDMKPYPLILSVYNYCLTMSEVVSASPESQPDYS